MTALASQIPDPVERARQVDQNWTARGLPALGMGMNYLSNGYYLERRAQLTGAWNGVRNNVSLTSFYSQRARLFDPSQLLSTDDLANYERTQDWGISLFANHSLTPYASLNLSGTLSRSRGEGATEAQTRRRTIQAGASSVFGPRSSGNFLYRYSSSDGVTDYRENAVVANLGLRF